MNEDRIKEELIKELKKFSSTYDFIIGVLSDAKQGILKHRVLF